MSIRFSELGLEFKLENPDWVYEKAKREKNLLLGQSSWARAADWTPIDSLINLILVLKTNIGFWKKNEPLFQDGKPN